MYPELITRSDLKVFLPPIGGISVYIFGNPEYVSGKIYIEICENCIFNKCIKCRSFQEINSSCA